MADTARFTRLSPPAVLEDEILAYWEGADVFHRQLEQNKEGERWVFFEGPPTANGTPHNGHVLTRVMKDVFPRFHSMRGKLVHRKAGWDTHGLPVEVEVEKNLGIHGRAAIEDYGLERFSHTCMDSVFTYINEWEVLTKQVGFWVDLEEAYVTFHRSYVESVWWALSELFKKGLLYQGHKVVWWWPQGGTTLSAGEVGMGYKTVDDPAVTVRFRDADDPTVSFLAWTTTPWTLPSNVALAVGADVDYAFCDDGEGGQVVLAAARAEAYGLEPLRTVKGSELVGRRYTPLYDFGAPEGGDAFVVVTGAHVTTGSGTGIVHTAPAFGEDDFKVKADNGLGLLNWIEPDGTFSAEAGEWLAGVFCKDADKLIIRELKERGLLFKRETYRHEYPFCWRADSDPLIQYARPAWFIRTTALNAEALANNQAVDWLPEHIKDGRFGDFLRNNVDWALSRERFWGTPLNIWECEACGHRHAPASTAEIAALNPDAFDPAIDTHLQVHRPWIDNVTLPCGECGSTMNRVPEVIDCWFDSGCMPFAQWGWPHQGQEQFAASFPADFISEAVDQTRGWFYSLLMISTLLFDDETMQAHGLAPVGMPRPYKQCVVLGHVTDMEGRKESKSKGNYTSPNLVFRGKVRLDALPVESLKRGQVGLKKDQVRGLEISPKERITISTDEAGEHGLPMKLTDCDLGNKKDCCGLHPDDLEALGLPREGGKAWFRVPFEAPGADAFRWLFCVSNPPWSNTRLSLRAIRDGQREFLLRLRNVHQFFSIYANIAAEKGQFDPAGTPPRAPAERSLLDRWILHELTATTQVVTEMLEATRVYEAARALLAFVDALSNWYVRRSRSRFWGEGAELEDALWTLHEVLATTSQLIAPFVPFTAEGIWRSLAPAGQPDSVHLSSWPVADTSLLDPELHERMALIRELTSLGLAARTDSKIKVRQPLEKVTVVLADPSQEAAVRDLKDVLLEELNVRALEFAANASEYVAYTVKPDFRALGRELGKDMKSVAKALGAMDGASAKAQLDADGIFIDLGHRQVTLTSEQCQVQVQAVGDWQAASSPLAVVALDTQLSESLLDEGRVRELTNRIQGLRKQLDLGYTQRIELGVYGSGAVVGALQRFGDRLAHEVLATRLDHGASAPPGETTEIEVEGETVQVQLIAL